MRDVKNIILNVSRKSVNHYWFKDFNVWRYFTPADPTSYGPQHEKTCLRGFANNTGSDQPAHPRSLISAFVIHFLEIIICKLATGEISIF